MTNNYIIFVATKEENVYVRARCTHYWIINCHYYHESDHFMYEIVWEHNPVWIKNLCVTQNCIITELNRQQVKGHLPVIPQKYQSTVHWICPCCFAEITAAVFIKTVITVSWCCFCLGCCSSLLSDGILVLLWTWY